jgi:hypothetical protein
MKTTSKHNEVRLTGSEPDKTHDLQTAGRRQSLLTLFALAITAGCSSGGSSSVRDTNPGNTYYGHSHFHRSPYRRYPRRRY